MWNVARVSNAGGFQSRVNLCNSIKNATHTNDQSNISAICAIQTVHYKLKRILCANWIGDDDSYLSP